MIIKSNTEDGGKAKIFDKDGNVIDLPICEYDTETQIAKYYEYDEFGRIKFNEWKEVEPGKGVRQPLILEKHLPESYVEIDGKKVE